jgi:hypothetical protein
MHTFLHTKEGLPYALSFKTRFVNKVYLIENKMIIQISKILLKPQGSTLSRFNFDIPRKLCTHSDVPQLPKLDFQPTRNKVNFSFSWRRSDLD